jgi:hypothetical protein
MKHNRKELEHIIFRFQGFWPSPQYSTEELLKMLDYTDVIEKPNPVDDKRKYLMSFIEKYNDQLALPCDGICANHPDVIVIDCYNKMRSEHGDNEES